MVLPPPSLKALSPAHRNRLAPTPPSSRTSPLPPPFTPGIGVTSVLGTRALGTRWYPPMVSFVLPSRYPLPTMPSSLPLLLWGLAEGRAGTSHPLGTVPRPQGFGGSWPWGAAGRMERGEGKGDRDSAEERVAGEAQTGGSRMARPGYKTALLEGLSLRG